MPVTRDGRPSSVESDGPGMPRSPHLVAPPEPNGIILTSVMTRQSFSRETRNPARASLLTSLILDLIPAALLYPLFCVGIALGAPPSGACDIPQDLQREIVRKYPGEKLVQHSDLGEYDRKLFQEHHGKSCPGAVRINFYGDGKPTWALVLITGENPKRRAELVVAHLVDQGWETRILETTDGTPVIWPEKPGKYEDLNGEKTIRASRPVIIFAGLESWAIVYAWNGKAVEKVQVSD